jgi:hypothetical protein
MNGDPCSFKLSRGTLPAQHSRIGFENHSIENMVNFLSKELVSSPIPPSSQPSGVCFDQPTLFH